jgi:tetratricopeptide (TPR) repeat protein
MIKWFALLAFVPGFSWGQTPEIEQAHAWQDSTWANLFTNEERALEFVEQVLALEGLPDTLLANTFNHLAIHHGLNFRNDSARIHFERAVLLMAEAPKRQSVIARNLGLVLKDLGEFDRARDEFKRALAIHESLGDQRQIAMDHCAIANLHAARHEIKEAVTAFNQGLQRFDLADERARISYWIEQCNLGFIYVDAGQYAFAEQLFRSSSEGLLENGRRAQGVLALTNLVNVLLFQSKWDEAQRVLDDIHRLNESPSPTVYAHEARLRLRQGRIHEALDILWDLYPTSFEGFHNGSYFLCNLLEALIANGQAEEALRIALRIKALHPELYHDYGNDLESVATWALKAAAAVPNASQESREIAQILDTLVDLTFQRLDDRAGVLQGRFELEFVRLEGEALAEKNALLEAERDATARANSLLAWGLLVLTGALLLLGIVSRLRRRLQLKSAEAERSAAELAVLRSEQLAEEMRIKESELVATTMEHAAFEKRIERALAAMKQKGVANEDLAPLIRAQEETLLFEHFRLRFQGIHPEFDRTLLERYPELTANDLEFCQLLKLGLSHREIAELLNISSSSVMTRKYRLRKRMGLEEGDRVEDHLP